MVGLHDLTQLIGSIQVHSFIPYTRIVIRLPAAHPAGTVDLSFGKASCGTLRPCVDKFPTAELMKDPFLAGNDTLTLLAIVTAVSVQL